MTTLSKLNSLALLAAISLATGCSSSTSPQNANTGGPGGTIYFTELYRGIETLNLSDGLVTSLVNGDNPNVRPDKWILCVVENNLEFLSPDGTQKQVIVPINTRNASAYDDAFHDPQLSPNGRYIAYDQQFQELVFVVNASDGSLVASYGNPSTHDFAAHPSWGKDGSLYLEAVPDAVQPVGGIYKTNNTFTSIDRIDQKLSAPTQPTVSPDGTTIAFIQNSHLWTMGSDGSNPKQLTTSDRSEIYPTWSPDSKWIAIVNSAGDIFLIPVSGGAAISLQAQFPTSFGSHSSSRNGQMDWK